MSKRKGYNCPVCNEIFTKDELDTHVDQHFSDDKDETTRKCTIEGCNIDVEVEEWEDHLLAHKMCDNENDINHQDKLLAIALQAEEDEKEERNDNIHTDAIVAKALQNRDNEKLEKEEFEKLQKLYGMNSKDGGYSKQFNNTMQKRVGRGVSIGEYFNKKANMMCSMITGEDSNETRTQGIIPVLMGFYACGINGISKAYLCSDTDHYSSDISDKGWGCGYRNAQMLLSSLLKFAPFKDLIMEKTELAKVPSIPKLQTLIEQAWKDGFDGSGCEQLGGRLNGTRKWIGTTEVTALLRWMGIRARIVDFHEAAKGNTHPLLFEWVDNYFKKNQSPNTSSHTLPLYLQHDGHSRTIIGLEEHIGGDPQYRRHILLFDPSVSPSKMNCLKNLKMPCNKTQTKDLRKSLKQLRCSQFQIIFIDGVYSNEDEKNESKILASIRISNGEI